MVALDVLQWGFVLAQADEKPRLPEPVRVYALMALLGIALLGMLIVVFILLGGHWVRKIGKFRRGPVVPPDVVLRSESDSDVVPIGDSDQPTDETSITQDTKNA